TPVVAAPHRVAATRATGCPVHAAKRSTNAAWSGARGGRAGSWDCRRVASRGRASTHAVRGPRCAPHPGRRRAPVPLPPPVAAQRRPLMAHFDHATGREGRGGRKLIVCCDGTNNTLTGGVHDTNVLRLFTELRRLHDGAVLYYDPGVGAPDELPPTGIRQYLRRKWDRVAGLASGPGVVENIGEAYSFLVREYRAGDEIWLFGFSRGAFTARSGSGMVHLFGIVRPEHLVLLPTMLRVYFSSRKRRKRRARRHTGERRTRDVVAEQIRTTFTSPEGREAHVHFVGVWDTVESVGMPGMSLQISSSATIRGKRICHVRHALSLDEHRWPFLPRLYDEDDFGSPEDGQSL